MSSLWWILIGVGAALAVAAAAVTIAVVVRGRAGRALSTAWEQLDRDPSSALLTFTQEAGRLDRELARSANRPAPAQAEIRERVQRARVGRALCCLKLARVDDAAGAETAARELGPLPIDLLARLAAAWLDLNPVAWPQVGLQDLVEYLGQSASAQRLDLRQRVVAVVLPMLTLPPRPSREQAQTVISLAKRLVAAAPDLDEAHYRLGVACHAAGQLDEACASLDVAARAAPDVADRQLALARALKDARRIIPARSAYLAAYRLRRDADTAYAAGLACLETSDVPFQPRDGQEVAGRQPLVCAQRLLSEATMGRPDWLEAWLARAETAVRMRDFAGAAQSLDEARRLDPDNPAVNALRGVCCLEQNDFDGARQALDVLKRRSPGAPEIDRLEGELAYHDGDYAAALPRFRKRDFAGDPRGRVRLARCELEAGDLDACERQLSDTDLDAESRLILGRCQARQGRWAAALRTLMEAAGTTATPEYAYYYANALSANGRHAESARLFRQLAEHPQWGRRARWFGAQAAHLAGEAATAAEWIGGEESGAAREFAAGRFALLRGDVAAAGDHFGRCDPAEAERAFVGADAARFARAYTQAWLSEGVDFRPFESDADAMPYLHEAAAHREFAASRFRQALELYEKAIRQRSSVPAGVLARLSTGYVLQQRYRDALPHLVALAKRHPQNRAVRENLAHCRFQIAREHYRHSRWEAALLEFEAARELLEQLDAPQAAGVAVWESECRFRAGVHALTVPLAGGAKAETKTKKAGKAPAVETQPRRASEMFQEGERNEPREPRWSFGASLAAAAQGQFGPSAEAAGRAAKLLPQHVGAALAHSLSLQAAERSAEARGELNRSLELLSSVAAGDARGEFLILAARIALATSFARDKNWIPAAEALQPLLGHPMMGRSSRIRAADIAKAIVAYRALGGDKAGASETARRHLPGESLGDLMIALAQAEAADYSGAAQTLEGVATSAPEPRIEDLLVGCLLAAAADAVKREDLPKAKQFVDRALKRRPKDVAAQRLKEALGFAEGFKDFNPARLEAAITCCRSLVETSRAAQLVRTMGVLLHRKAFLAESNGRSPDAAWNECHGFWTSRILNDNGFWKNYLEEYNAGKGRREKVKDEDMAQWRADLAEDLARDHVDLAFAGIRQRDQAVTKRQLELVWKWKDDFTMKLEEFLKQLGDFDDGLSRFLTSLASGVSHRQATRLVCAAKAFDHIKKKSAALEALQRSLAMMSAGNPAAVFSVRNHLAEARTEARNARDWAAKAKNAVPSDKEIAELYDGCSKEFIGISDLCQKAGI